ncbi:MAG TPA: S8 family serine peptidase [Gaiellaceae bacterium]|nr:S8 family serine peptidase [Gaiellaceae bacterium]
MRRLLVPMISLAALALAASAPAALRPVDRTFGELTVPRVRAGTLEIPRAQRSGRVTVIATLRLPPLAAARGPGFFATLGPSRLDETNASSRAYLARVQAEQASAARAIRAAVPEARLGRRFQVVLNGITVRLPARRLPALYALSSLGRVYPSVRFLLKTNRSPGVIGATAFTASTGANGAGVKIAVVDDGIDQRNPSFDPSGFTYPAGFPKGQTGYTTPKVIVARSFVAPGGGRRARLPVDPKASYHGTHVAGIAAGRAGTSSPGGRDHPPTSGLGGVAPGAWIGNYRVFNTPSPAGNISTTDQTVAAFEAAVRDGMDVINYSGGSAAIDPRTDALIETVANVTRAGVVVVASAGNDRDDFGLGTTGSPSTSPEAIGVAATSNSHVFAPALAVSDAVAPAVVRRIPFKPDGNGVPSAWGQSDRQLVDVTSITGTDGRPVPTQLCGIGRDPNAGRNPLPRGSLAGSLALISRGHCTFVSKAIRAVEAGAGGLVIVDNRFGEANPIPVTLPFRMGMISDLDGANLRAYLAGRGGRAPIRIGPGVTELETGRSGIITSFSAGGPTPFGHNLKPDVAAPGGEILAATLPGFTGGSPFADFDGTSMSAPHVTGAVALLRQRHRDWTVRQVKSALMSTAGAAWGNSQRTQEASVLLQGAGLVNVPAADDPKIFTEPGSLSFGDLNLLAGVTSKQLLLSVKDAGGGAGTWTVELRPQSASSGANIDVPGTVTMGPGGTVDLSVTARADAAAPKGDDYGFLVLRRGAVTRRVPYAFFVTRPGLATVSARPLARHHTGTTASGPSRADTYRFPTAPFRLSPDYGVGPDMREEGGERLYSIRVRNRVVNIGAAVVTSSPNAVIDPFFLGAKDENAVQGYVGTPANINGFTIGYQLRVGAAGAVFAPPGTYYLAVDSGRDEFTNARRAGKYTLRSWVNDVTAPSVSVLTTRVTAGRPTIAIRTLDRGASVDPFSLTLNYGRVLVGAAAYDPSSGVALFPLPSAAPVLRAGRRTARFLSSDYQEAKNADVFGDELMPNTRVKATRLRVVRGPTLTWLTPFAGGCVGREARLLVVAGPAGKARAARFFDGRRQVRELRRNVVGLYATTWRTRGARRGLHTLRAVVRIGGKRVEATRAVRVCR